jgi:hypothetical protein
MASDNDFDLDVRTSADSGGQAGTNAITNYSACYCQWTATCFTHCYPCQPTPTYVGCSVSQCCGGG